MFYTWRQNQSTFSLSISRFCLCYHAHMDYQSNNIGCAWKCFYGLSVYLHKFRHGCLFVDQSDVQTNCCKTSTDKLCTKHNHYGICTVINSNCNNVVTQRFGTRYNLQNLQLLTETQLTENLQRSKQKFFKLFQIKLWATRSIRSSIIKQFTWKCNLVLVTECYHWEQQCAVKEFLLGMTRPPVDTNSSTTVSLPISSTTAISIYSCRTCHRNNFWTIVAHIRHVCSNL